MCLTCIPQAVRDRIDARRLSGLLEDKQHLCHEKGKERDREIREMDEVIEIDRSTSSPETF